MKTIQSPELVKRMADDPWFADANLDLSGMPQYLQPSIQPEADPFEQVPQPKPLTAREREKIAASDPLTVQECVDDLATSGHWSPDEKQAVLAKFSPAPKRPFYVGNQWKCSAEYLPGSGWQVRAEHSEDGTLQAFKVPGIRRDDFDSVVERSISYLAAVSHNKKPYRDLTPGELDDVARLASGGDIGSMFQAGERYIAYALADYANDDEFNLNDCRNDTRFTPLWDSACWFVFLQGRPDVTEDGQRYIEQLLEGRTVTINSLWNAYETWLADKAKGSTGRLFNREPEPEPEVNLDALSDDEIAAQLRATRLYAARGNR